MRAVSDAAGRVRHWDEAYETRSASASPGYPQVVANRIVADTPPEFWQTVQRLTRHGYRRHDVLHMLGSVVSDEVYGALMSGETLSDEEVGAALFRVPGDNPPKRATRHPKGGESH